jgi:NAD(P)-dependent dehydrogenase (short-subunit alcohol dehydrogenase family)
MTTWHDGMSGKTVIVTGGSKGIGKGCARVFSAAGANVVICSRNEAEGQDTAREISEQTTGSCTFCRADMASEDDIRNLVDFTITRFGQLDCLINNAGFYMEEKPIDEFSLADMRRIFDVNFFGQFLGCKYALPHLRKTKGNIINVGSVVYVTGQEGAIGYCATKGAIAAFTRTLAVDESVNGVRVNAILPGHINTELYYENKKRADDPDAFEEYSNHVQWMGRGGESEEVGKACYFLASDLGSFVTGIELLVTGGYEIGEGYKTRRMHWGTRMRIAK